MINKIEIISIIDRCFIDREYTGDEHAFVENVYKKYLDGCYTFWEEEFFGNVINEGWKSLKIDPSTLVVSNITTLSIDGAIFFFPLITKINLEFGGVLDALVYLNHFVYDPIEDLEDTEIDKKRRDDFKSKLSLPERCAVIKFIEYRCSWDDGHPPHEQAILSLNGSWKQISNSCHNFCDGVDDAQNGV